MLGNTIDEFLEANHIPVNYNSLQYQNCRSALLFLIEDYNSYEDQMVLVRRCQKCTSVLHTLSDESKLLINSASLVVESFLGRFNQGLIFDADSKNIILGTSLDRELDTLHKNSVVANKFYSEIPVISMNLFYLGKSDWEKNSVLSIPENSVKISYSGIVLPIDFDSLLENPEICPAILPRHKIYFGDAVLSQLLNYEKSSGTRYSLDALELFGLRDTDLPIAWQKILSLCRDTHRLSRSMPESSGAPFAIKQLKIMY